MAQLALCKLASLVCCSLLYPRVVSFSVFHCLQVIAGTLNVAAESDLEP